MWLTIFIVSLISCSLSNADYIAANISKRYDLRCFDGDAVQEIFTPKLGSTMMIFKCLDLIEDLHTDELLCRFTDNFLREQDFNFNKTCKENEYISGIRGNLHTYSVRCCSAPKLEVLQDTCSYVTLSEEEEESKVLRSALPSGVSNQRPVVLHSIAVKQHTLVGQYCSFKGGVGTHQLIRKKRAFPDPNNDPCCALNNCAGQTCRYFAPEAAAAAAAAAASAAGSASAASAAASAAAAASASAAASAAGFSAGMCTVSQGSTAGLSVSVTEADFIFQQLITSYSSTSVTYIEVISSTVFVFAMQTTVLQQIIESTQTMFIESSEGYSLEVTSTSILEEFPPEVGSNPCTCEINSDDSDGSDSEESGEEQGSDSDESSGSDSDESSGSDSDESSGSDSDESSGSDSDESSGSDEGSGSDESSGSQHAEIGSGKIEVGFNEEWYAIECIFKQSMFKMTKSESIYIEQQLITILETTSSHIEYVTVTSSSSFSCVVHESIYELLIQIIESGQLVIESRSGESGTCDGYEEISGFQKGYEKIGTGTTISVSISESCLSSSRYESINIIEQLTKIMHIEWSSIYSCEITSGESFTIEIHSKYSELFFSLYSKTWFYSLSDVRFQLINADVEDTSGDGDSSSGSNGSGSDGSGSSAGETLDVTISEKCLTVSQTEVTNLIEQFTNLLRIESSSIYSCVITSSSSFTITIEETYVESFYSYYSEAWFYSISGIRFQLVEVETLDESSGEDSDGGSGNSHGGGGGSGSKSTTTLVTFLLDEKILTKSVETRKSCINSLVYSLRCSRSDITEYTYISSNSFSVYMETFYIRYLNLIYDELIFTTSSGRCGTNVDIEGFDDETSGADSETSGFEEDEDKWLQRYCKDIRPSSSSAWARVKCSEEKQLNPSR